MSDPSVVALGEYQRSRCQIRLLWLERVSKIKVSDLSVVALGEYQRSRCQIRLLWPWVSIKDQGVRSVCCGLGRVSKIKVSDLSVVALGEYQRSRFLIG